MTEPNENTESVEIPAEIDQAQADPNFADDNTEADTDTDESGE